MTLEAVREEMDAGTWLCPHCYEDDHPDEVQLSLLWSKCWVQSTGLNAPQHVVL